MKLVADEGSFTPLVLLEINGKNPLDYPGYEEKLEEVRNKTNLDEAVYIGKGKIDGSPVVLGACDTRFLMGSMGYAVGEKIALAFERAVQEKVAVILFCIPAAPVCRKALCL